MIVGSSEATPLEIALNAALLELPRVESVELRRGVVVEVVVPDDEWPKRLASGVVEEFNKTFPDERIALKFRTR